MQGNYFTHHHGAFFARQKSSFLLVIAEKCACTECNAFSVLYFSCFAFFALFVPDSFAILAGFAFHRSPCTLQRGQSDTPVCFASIVALDAGSQISLKGPFSTVSIQHFRAVWWIIHCEIRYRSCDGSPNSEIRKKPNAEKVFGSLKAQKRRFRTGSTARTLNALARSPQAYAFFFDAVKAAVRPPISYHLQKKIERRLLVRMVLHANPA